LLLVGDSHLSILLGGVVTGMVRDQGCLATVGFLFLIFASTSMGALGRETIVELEKTQSATSQLETSSASRHTVISRLVGTMDMKRGSSIHSDVIKAFFLSIVSGLSFPIGASLGIVASPVKDATCAGMIAFGAGALLFAVTVELYGEALRELAETKGEHKEEIFIIIFGAILGALLFLHLNRRIQQTMVSGAVLEPDTLDRQFSEGTDSRSSHSVREQVRAFEREILPEDREELELKAKQVAFSLFLGLLIEGVPEGVLMGLLAAEDHLSMVFIVSLFIANFPEAFAASSLLCEARYRTPTIVCMWAALCLLIGVLTAVSSWVLLGVYPNYGEEGVHLPMLVRMGIALVEGTTGGVIIACISAVMLPEAFERTATSGHICMSSGFMCTCGFVLAVALKVWEVA